MCFIISCCIVHIDCVARDRGLRNRRCYGKVSEKMLRGMFAVWLVLVRLLVALGCGWLIGFFAARDYNVSIIRSVGYALLLLPLLFGIASAWTIHARNTYLVVLAMATGMCIPLGIYLYLLPFAMSEDAQEIASCAHSYCHVSGWINTAVLTIALLYSLLCVIIGAVVMGLVRRRWWRASEQREAARHEWDG